MVVFAHPDDESFTCGGSMARYALAGHPVHIVCATRGEVGDISDPKLATKATLGEVREQELRSAARALGAADPLFLGYRDSGMRGWQENNDPRSLYQAPHTSAVEQITGIIRRLRPGVVITFDETGGYGHPDHVAIHHHTTAAFWAAGRRDSFAHQLTHGLRPWQPMKLYYTASPRRFWQGLLDAAMAAGVEPPPFVWNRTIRGTPDEYVTTEIDVSAHVETKRMAVLAHATQITPNNPFTRLPNTLMAQFQSREFFQRVFPYAQNGVTERDLFTGISGD
jgi:LmbE family N-acetylglucosaminyl deacetylase